MRWWSPGRWTSCRRDALQTRLQDGLRYLSRPVPSPSRTILGKTRLEAFSNGVITVVITVGVTVVITIMVPEMQVPHGPA